MINIKLISKFRSNLRLGKASIGAKMDANTEYRHS